MLSFIAALTLGNVVTLDATTESLDVTTSTAASTDYTTSWVDLASGTPTPGSTHGNIASATTTAVAAAPAASTQRAISAVTLCNVSTTTSQTVVLKHDTSGTERVIGRAALAPSECVVWANDGTARILGSTGVPRVTADPPGFTGRTYRLAKSATALDAAGYHYLANKDSGWPGAWNVGTPGVNGVATACDVVGGATGGAVALGAPVLADPASGALYLTRWGTNGAAINTYELIDILWYNTGLVVTTTTAQTIVSPAWPARDVNGSTNGEGVYVALYALTALGNVAAVANTTLQYTNSAGTAGRTGTFPAAVGFQAPATAVIGTWMPFSLQAGDTGVQSIQSVTLATTYTSGTMMLIAYRPIALDGVALANGPSGSLVSSLPLNPGIRVYNDTCFGVTVIGSPATTAPSFTGGLIELMER